MNASRTLSSKLAPVAFATTALIFAIAASLTHSFGSAQAQTSHFHDAPASAAQMKNPLAGQADAATAGARLYVENCALCHGNKAQGMANMPALASGPTQSAADGELFWYITRGDVANGMPSWQSLPVDQRWQIVAFLKSLSTSHPAAIPRSHRQPNAPSEADAPAPPAPFTDYRYEKPGVIHKITVADLPAPYLTRSAQNSPDLVPRPANAWPQAPAGFTVQLYASGLDNPRLITAAPNGDIFVAESEPGDIKVFRGISADGKAQQSTVFASRLNRPYGIAFYPPGPDPQWIYIGNTNSIVRYPYRNGDLGARGPSEHLADLPGDLNHWTRPIVFTPDGKIMFVAVGSASNVDDPDTHSYEKDRADILAFNPDGSAMRILAWGLRNAGGGMAIDPDTGELWCSVNERDALGDNLPPDYITHVQPGGFYGWPWFYIGGHWDPRLQGKHPELKNEVIVPDVLLQPHNASLNMVFYEASQFPAEYRGDLFASEHGSWNRTVRAGYEVIRVPLHHTGHASGDYEDFLTGFVLPDGNAWGRPVGITVANDGSLLVTDDGSNSIWRVTYIGASDAPAHTPTHSHK